MGDIVVCRKGLQAVCQRPISATSGGEGPRSGNQLIFSGPSPVVTTRGVSRGRTEDRWPATATGEEREYILVSWLCDARPQQQQGRWADGIGSASAKGDLSNAFWDTHPLMQFRSLN